MLPGSYDLDPIILNADYLFSFQWMTVTCEDDDCPQPVNLTGYTVRIAFANSRPPTSTYLTATSSGGSPLITFPEITEGQVQLLIPQATVASVFADLSSCVYDVLLINPSGGIENIFGGNVPVLAGVTTP